MFELIISNVNTGRVYRWHFPTRERAERHADAWVNRTRAGRRGYRIEVYRRAEPTAPVPAAA
jgi:hypothetical protein